MSDLISNLAKKNIHITLVGGSDLDVIAPDEIWDNGLEDYLKTHKQEIISELLQAKDLTAAQEKIENTNPPNLATTATIATIRTDSAIPLATLGLQVATRHPVGDTANTANQCSSLQWWIEQLKECFNQKEVFNLLKQFQPLNWTDVERATMAHAYHRRLESVSPERLPAAWYEIEQALRMLVPGLPFEHSANLIKRQIAQQTQSEQAQILKQLEAWSARHTHRDWARQLIKAVVE